MWPACPQQYQGSISGRGPMPRQSCGIVSSSSSSYRYSAPLSTTIWGPPVAHGANCAYTWLAFSTRCSPREATVLITEQFHERQKALLVTTCPCTLYLIVSLCCLARCPHQCTAQFSAPLTANKERHEKRDTKCEFESRTRSGL